MALLRSVCCHNFLFGAHVKLVNPSYIPWNWEKCKRKYCYVVITHQSRVSNSGAVLGFLNGGQWGIHA